MILVTGGAGYIGLNVVWSLVKSGLPVVVLDSLERSCVDARSMLECMGIVGFYRGDIRDRKVLTRIFSEKKISTVVHLAGLKSVPEGEADPDRYFDVNVVGTQLLLLEMDFFNVKSIVFSSSAAVYGLNGKCVTETVVPEPISTYGHTKLLAERKIENFCCDDSSRSAAIFRYFNPVGAGFFYGQFRLGDCSGESLMCKLVEEALTNSRNLKVFGGDYDTQDGSAIRDFLDISDLANAHVKYLVPSSSERRGSEIYNLGRGSGVSVLELLGELQSVGGTPIEFQLAERRAGDVTSSFCEVSKVRHELGWQPFKTIGSMCRSSLAYGKTRAFTFQ